ncbi:MAG: M67 family metallopeptidase [Chloroflexota bacterium]|nr:M67 family metallopeptidase [Chloroflexota bacterium]
MVVVFSIEKHYLEEMIAHARQETPNECCGVLAGRDGRVLKLYRATNAEQSPYRYEVDSRDLFRIHRECEDSDWQFLGIYHSHTASEAYPSPTDVRLALWPESLYFLVSLRDPQNPVVRAFRILDGRVSEEELQVVE